MTPGEFRLRVRFGKTGRLRWLSHLEVVHALERLVRRAGLPCAITQGFHPHLKIAFGPALPVGTGGENEYFDVWLTRYTGAEEVLRTLREHAPDDLAPTAAGYVPDKLPSLTAALTIAEYDVELTGREIDHTQVQAALERTVSAREFTMVHKGKQKVFDLARAVPKDVRASDRGETTGVELAVRMGPEGSLRPDALIRAALAGAGLTPSVLRTTRRELFTEDPEGEWSRPL